MNSEDGHLIHVTKRHSIRIPDEIQALVDRPQDNDFVIRQLSVKLANGQPLIQGELIVSGHRTRNQFPLANDYPVHFRKTYYPTCFHQNPQREFNLHQRAAEILNTTPPIGWTKTTFRSCFIPGSPYNKLSPFGVEPITRNLTLGEDLPVPMLIGLWMLLQQLYDKLKALHHQGMTHGDLFLHNVIVPKMPINIHLIDFELAKTRDESKTPQDWHQRLEADCAEIWKHAIYLQCALGRQTGALAEDSLNSIPKFFNDPDAVHRRLELATPR